MHIPDGLLNNTLANGLLAGTIGMFGYYLSKIFKTAIIFTGTIVVNNGTRFKLFGLYKNPEKYFQKMTIIALWIFAFQMLNIPINSTTSAHLIGGTFAAVLTGPISGFIILSYVLIIQAFFFSDGGIIALGANIFNMAFVGSFLSYYIYKMLYNKGYYLAIFSACFFSIILAALSCLIELKISKVISLTMTFKNMMQVHIIIALLESVLTLLLLKIFKNLYGDNNE
ncbi:MAG: energy-coupling factor ABC transporter permease [Endomicrobium sp.]|jgi:cobalt/nickel transport system permease protein|nr:energy-coupling factor ABC transporter permease [Endomicrobium sp.]